ncbi:acyl carrier protein [Clostridium sediminicola]|uniref:acyl carrier protein n=1 Tax=Clostridium sediminicola TaxID=3114879 RepID=UPI0031F21A6F
MIFEKVAEMIAEQLGISVDSIGENTSLIEDLGADSLDVVELIMACEDEFGVEIPDENAEKMSTIKDVVEYITNHSEE